MFSSQGAKGRVLSSPSGPGDAPGNLDIALLIVRQAPGANFPLKIGPFSTKVSSLVSLL